MAELTTEEKRKIHKKEVISFLKYLIENPDHEIRIADMYSGSEALLWKKDAKKWFKVWDDPESETTFLDYDDVLKAIGLWEE